MCATCSTPVIPSLCIIQQPWREKKNFAYDTCSVGFCFYIRSFVRIGCVSMRIKDNPILRLANKLLPNTRSKTSKHIKSPSKIIGRKKNKEKIPRSLNWTYVVCHWKKSTKCVQDVVLRRSKKNDEHVKLLICVFVNVQMSLVASRISTSVMERFYEQFPVVHPFFSAENTLQYACWMWFQAVKICTQSFRLAVDFGNGWTIVSDIKPITLLVWLAQRWKQPKSFV